MCEPFKSVMSGNSIKVPEVKSWTRRHKETPVWVLGHEAERSLFLLLLEQLNGAADCTALRCPSAAHGQVTRLKAESTEHDRCHQGHPRGRGMSLCHSCSLSTGDSTGETNSRATSSYQTVRGVGSLGHSRSLRQPWLSC